MGEKKEKKKKSPEKEDELFGAVGMLFAALSMITAFIVKQLILRKWGGKEEVKKTDEGNTKEHSGKN